MTRQAGQLPVAVPAFIAGGAHEAVVLTPADADRTVAVKHALGVRTELWRAGRRQDFGAEQELRAREITPGCVTPGEAVLPPLCLVLREEVGVTATTDL